MSLRYSLSELVVFFYPNFEINKTIDPLRLSKKSLPLDGWKTLSLLFLTFFVFPLFLDSSFEHAHLLYEPTGRFVQAFLYSVLNIFTYILIFKFFIETTEEINV